MARVRDLDADAALLGHAALDPTPPRRVGLEVRLTQPLQELEMLAQERLVYVATRSRYNRIDVIVGGVHDPSMMASDGQ